MLHKKIAKQCLGLYTKKFISKSSLKSNQRSKRRLFNPPVHNKIAIFGPDEHYGATADIETSPDMPKHEYDAKKILFLSKLNVTQAQIKQIEKGI